MQTRPSPCARPAATSRSWWRPSRRSAARCRAGSVSGAPAADAGAPLERSGAAARGLAAWWGERLLVGVSRDGAAVSRAGPATGFSTGFFPLGRAARSGLRPGAAGTRWCAGALARLTGREGALAGAVRPDRASPQGDGRGASGAHVCGAAGLLGIASAMLPRLVALLTARSSDASITIVDAPQARWRWTQGAANAASPVGQLERVERAPCGPPAYAGRSLFRDATADAVPTPAPGDAGGANPRTIGPAGGVILAEL